MLTRDVGNYIVKTHYKIEVSYKKNFIYNLHTCTFCFKIIIIDLQN